MPHKYEMFLDKNKKVKLAANDQGEFFMEANGNVVKINDDGMKLGKRAEGGIDGLKEIGSGGTAELSFAPAELGKPVAFEAVDTLEETLIPNNLPYNPDLQEYMAYIDARDGLIIDFAITNHMGSGQDLFQYIPGTGQTINIVTTAGPGFDVDFVVTNYEVQYANSTYIDIQITAVPAEGSNLDIDYWYGYSFYVSDPSGVITAKLTRGEKYDALTFDGTNLLEGEHDFSTNSTSRITEKFTDLVTGNVTESWNGGTYIPIGGIESTPLPQFPSGWDKVLVLTDTVSNDQVTIIADSTNIDNSGATPIYKIYVKEVIQYGDTPFIGLYMDSFIRQRPIKIEIKEESIISPLRIQETNDQTVFKFEAGLFNENDSIFAFLKEVSFDTLFPDGSSKEIITYNTATDAATIDVKGIGANISNTDVGAFSLSPNHVMYTYKMVYDGSGNGLLVDAGNHFWPSKDGSGDFIMDMSSSDVPNATEPDKYAMDLRKAFGNSNGMKGCGIVKISWAIRSYPSENDGGTMIYYFTKTGSLDLVSRNRKDDYARFTPFLFHKGNDQYEIVFTKASNMTGYINSIVLVAEIIAQ